MTAKELIESGIVELYCLGIASEEERLLVESVAADNLELREEITAVHDALAKYAIASTAATPQENLKKKIFDSIQAAEVPETKDSFPPKVDERSNPGDWLNYLDQCQITLPETTAGLTMVELPGNEDFYTYVVFGNPGDVVEEELHTGHLEYLLVCSGTCEMHINGKSSHHRAGDLITITPGIRHSGRVTGTQRMIVIGQRRAA